MNSTGMILCCGEALIDLVPCRSSTGENAFLPLAGGAVYNTALALGRLEMLTGFFSGLSTDQFGRQLAEGLRHAGVDMSRVAWSERPTTLAIVELNRGEARYSFHDEGSAGRMITDADVPSDLNDVSALFFGGISLCQNPAAETYTRLCVGAAKDRVIVIDPNIRLSLVDDEAAYRQRLDAMVAVADIVKLSDQDLGWFIAGSGTTEEQARALAGRGPSLVCVTLGAGGSAALLPDGVWVRVPGEPVRVVDTVGAGDVFNAGVIASLSDQGLLSKSAIASVSGGAVGAALKLGNRAAAWSAQRAGAAAPRRQDLS